MDLESHPSDDSVNLPAQATFC